ncbi:MAG: hypothetical protein JW801_10605 [Bacteroidales bacterium]|nr:hypothetical protein [Bacteroidales bacterium]
MWHTEGWWLNEKSIQPSDNWQISGYLPRLSIVDQPVRINAAEQLDGHGMSQS